MKLIDEDTAAFNKIMESFNLPKGTDDEKKQRSAAIQSATLYAAEVPLRTMHAAYKTFELLDEMVQHGNPNSITDVGVGILCARTAVYGAYLNVIVNASGLKDTTAKEKIISEAKSLLTKALEREKDLLPEIERKAGS